ncbi:condensin complex subunit 2/barren [Dimargaris cristalligena]|uniref:Condensin complex subunit 2 n=1 Tax=Dimargaris cristalligena TaxID=215637 RepID=A0A4P9ZMQ4_9FUNG|nr:condensin complex subunit 2/barren [Dimargaris cristalligena]|eukprot:RKP34674.1 condensin complex subunit 2/barren [Dimargaris cristalligena]
MVSNFQGPFQTPKRSSTFVESEIPLNDSTNWNDDHAERRARRRSLASSGKRRSMLLSPGSTVKSLQTPSRKSLAQPLEVVGAGGIASPGSALQALTPEELTKRYEEWMKIAADNKINQQNTWQVALIDYFHDMSLFRDGDSINFQKASCTLDGCVKIYTSRVDSAANEAGRLLTGLAESSLKSRKNGRPGNADDDEDEDHGGLSDDGTSTQARKKRHRSTQGDITLVKDLAVISVKKFDLEFAVDPLFKKTSADFDEGGARGLLLNHLTLDVGGKIIFDAGDATVVAESDDEFESPATGEKLTQLKTEFAPALIDYTLLQSTFFNELAKNTEKDVCTALRDFQFSKVDSLDIAMLKQSLLDDPNDPNADGLDGEDQTNPLLDPPLGYDDGPCGGDDDDDDDGTGFAFGDDIADAEDGAFSGQANTLDGAEMVSGHAAGDGLAPPLALVDTQENDIFSYFDAKLIKSWAGTDHWKLHPALRSRAGAAPFNSSNIGGGDGTEPPKSRKRPRGEKVVYQTDFVNQPDLDEDQLFASPAVATSLMLSHSYQKSGSRDSRHLLPDDVQFKSKNLLSLFVKPRCRLRARELANSNNNNPNDADPLLNPGGLGPMEETDIGFGGDGGVSDDEGIDDGFGLDMDGGDDLVPSSQAFTSFGDEAFSIPQLKVIKPQFINYARTAKRVDVKKLKDNLWRKLTTAPDQVFSLEPEVRQVQGEQKFTNIMDGLKVLYPEKAIQDISVPFCFICLLHLANDHNLRIVEDGSLSDLIITQDAPVESISN